MILKQPDYQKAIDGISKLLDGGRVIGDLKQELVNRRAGFYAEKQMAYDLERYFQNTEDLFVWNNLKIQDGKINAQIDHLVYSRRAVYLIESKSIGSEIMVNEQGEFFRCYGRASKPIDSPIEQVKSQEKVLFGFLEQHREKFLGKILGMRKGLGSWTSKYYVAISKNGKITGKGRDKFAELRKYDQIPSLIDQHHKKTDVGFIQQFKSSDTESFNLFNAKELEQLNEFLKENDKAEEPIEEIRKLAREPRYQKDILPEEKVKAAVAAAGKPRDEKPKTEKKGPGNGFVCSKCGSGDLRVAFGRSYYFKCKSCEGNTPIQLVCERCGGAMKTRKQKNEFFKECAACGTSGLYFVNAD